MLKFCNAAVLEVLDMPLVIKNIEIPELEEGQVLVKVLFSGVCRSQLMEVRGGRGNDPWLPHLLGHEGSGIVLAVGQNVTKVKPGDEVILGWLKGEGLDPEGAKYTCGLEAINSGKVTTFSNYTISAESRVSLKPKGLSFEAAVLFGCALPTGAGMILNELMPSVDNSVIVLGLGGIGMSALATLKALNISTIIAIDSLDEKLELARELGATHCFNSKDIGFKKPIIDMTRGGADMCIESAGQVSTIELGFSLIRKNGGQLLFASHPPEGQSIRLAPHELISGKKIAGSWGGSSHPDRDIPRLYSLFKNAHTPLNLLVTKRYTLDQINLALTDLEAGKVFRPLIEMQHPESSLEEWA